MDRFAPLRRRGGSSSLSVLLLVLLLGWLSGPVLAASTQEAGGETVAAAEVPQAEAPQFQDGYGRYLPAAQASTGAPDVFRAAVNPALTPGPPEIPAPTQWLLVALTLALLGAGISALRRLATLPSA